jgi:hypothetical protein
MKPVHDDEIADFRSALENFCSCVPRVFRHQRKEASSGTMNDKHFISDLIRYLKT